MNADDFRERVEDARETELDRLGSSKRLVALTDATLDDDTVLRTAAASEAAAADVFEAWTGDSSGDAASFFSDLADREREHYDRVVDELDEDEIDAETGAVHDYLRDLDGTVERAGGVVGRGLVAERTLTQFVGYFVNQADEARADLFRDLKDETRQDTDAALDLLADAADGDGDVERAEEAALGAIDAAYEEYADALESMGVNAKSVC
jgi:ferritin